MAQLLVSVRSASEAETALAGGAALIDVKEPARGPLGRATEAVLADVLRSVGDRRPVSAALGELLGAWGSADELPDAVHDLAFVKWGLAGYGAHDPALWRIDLGAQAALLQRVAPPCRL